MPKQITTTEFMEYKKVIAVSGGTGSHVTTKSFNNTLRELIITPATTTTSYKYQLKDSDGTVILDGAKAAHTGRTGVSGPEVPLVDNITIELTSVSTDENITVKMMYY